MEKTHQLFYHAHGGCGRSSLVQEPFAVYTLNALPEPIALDRTEQLRHCELIWIQNGEGRLVVDTDSHELNEPTLFCLTPGCVRTLQATRLGGYYARIAPEYLNLIHRQFDVSFLLQHAGCGMIALDHNDVATETEAVMRRLLKEFNDTHALRADLLKAYLKILLIYLSREFNVNTEAMVDRHREMLRRFMELLRAQVHNKKLVSDYARDLCVTSNYLNAVVKKLTGITVSAHIQQYIVMEAKRHALYSGMCMKEIAVQLGFNDTAHFSKYFKNYSGTNFTSFRRTMMQHTS